MKPTREQIQDALTFFRKQKRLRQHINEYGHMVVVESVLQSALEEQPIDLKTLKQDVHNELIPTFKYDPAMRFQVVLDDVINHLAATGRLNVVAEPDQDAREALEAFNTWMDTPTNGVPPASRRLARHAETIRAALMRPSVGWMPLETCPDGYKLPDGWTAAAWDPYRFHLVSLPAAPKEGGK